MNDKTVPAIALTSLVIFGAGGASRSVEKGDQVDWPAGDFARAEKNGLVKAMPAAKPKQ